MGIDCNGAAFLKYCSKKRPFGKTATLGRQRLVRTKQDINLLFKYPKDYDLGNWGDDKLLKKEFGSSEIDIYDNSDYEGANKIADFGEPIKESDLYDTFLDFGSSEHIFNISQSFKNIIQLTKIGGTIIHSLPANNNFCHGFYQVAPELFFALYSPKNGFSETEIFLYEDRSKHLQSFIIKVDPSKIANFPVKQIVSNNRYDMTMWVKTKKIEKKEIKNVFQVQWSTKWKNKDDENSHHKSIEASATNYLKKFNLIYPTLRRIYRLINFFRYSLKERKYENYKSLGKKMRIEDLIK